MIKIGMMLGDRYEILEKIGTGGMSDVYKAKDHKLNRNIAVKVLKQEFSENNNFVNKFRTEAQAAAGLMHPNIVNVYDVGSEGGVHYIVMELVEGITLKKYIEKKVRLSAKEAVSIAIQISNGIEAAHNNHIIHRDIKPQNTIISKEGKVKVTDFGIASVPTLWAAFIILLPSRPEAVSLMRDPIYTASVSRCSRCSPDACLSTAIQPWR